MIHRFPIQLQTERLLLLPLNYSQLVKYMRTDRYDLERELKLDPHPRDIPPALAEALEYGILPTVANATETVLFSTLWTIVHKEQNVMIGDLCFKGAPDENGEIEIGYGTYPDFQCQGYMTEAIGAMIEWAMGQEDVRAIIAETESHNLASRRALEKNKFKFFKQEKDMLWWRLDFPQPR
nr:GNAT family N-acetyltransferase [Tellurirhabdus bombi]